MGVFQIVIPADFPYLFGNVLLLGPPVFRRLRSQGEPYHLSVTICRRRGKIRLRDGQNHRLAHLEQFLQHFPLVFFEGAAGRGEVDHQVGKLDIFLGQFPMLDRQGVQARRVHPGKPLSQCIVLDSGSRLGGVFREVVDYAQLTVFPAGLAELLHLAIMRLVEISIGGIPEVPAAHKVPQRAFARVYIGEYQSQNAFFVAVDKLRLVDLPLNQRLPTLQLEPGVVHDRAAKFLVLPCPGGWGRNRHPALQQFQHPRFPILDFHPVALQRLIGFLDGRVKLGKAVTNPVAHFAASFFTSSRWFSAA